MAHFAKVIDNKVVQVIVASPEIISSGVLGDPERYIQTSYNTRRGVHYDPETGLPSGTQEKALRANFASVGYIYDDIDDVFYEPSPFPSWSLNKDGYYWEPPIPYPSDGNLYVWNEDDYQTDTKSPKTNGWTSVET